MNLHSKSFKITRHVLWIILLLWIIAFPHRIQAAEDEHNPRLKQIEVFDIAQGKIVQKIPPSAEIQQEVEKTIQSVSGLVTRLHINPKQGYAIRFPINPAIELDKPYYQGTVEEMFLFIESSNKPYLLLFTEDQKPAMLHFEHDIQLLLKLLNVQVEPAPENSKSMQTPTE